MKNAIQNVQKAIRRALELNDATLLDKVISLTSSGDTIYVEFEYESLSEAEKQKKDVQISTILKNIQGVEKHLNIRYTITALQRVKDEVSSNFANASNIGSIQSVEDVKNANSKSNKVMNSAINTKYTKPNAKHIIAVSSCKGGVGKSTVASMLALGLAREGYKTGLLDLDIYGPSIPTIFKTYQKPETQDDMYIPIELDHNLYGMSFGFIIDRNSASLWRGPMATKAVTQLFMQTSWPSSGLDYLILDLPPGTGDIHLTIGQKFPIDGIVLVTTPHAVSLADVARSKDMYNTLSIPVKGMVSNMSYVVAPDGEVMNLFGDASLISKEIDIPVIQTLPIIQGDALNSEEIGMVHSQKYAEYCKKLALNVADSLT